MRGLVRGVAAAVFLPMHLAGYFKPETGAAFGLGALAKLRLLRGILRAARGVTAASEWPVHVMLATRILQTGPEVRGVLVECGCYKGASSASLSLVAAACGRELHIFDSFEGLPEPDDQDRAHLILSKEEVQTYEAGAYAGALDEVKANIAEYGDISVCHFHKGWVEDTLPEFHEAVAFAYIDVDLVSAEKTCLRYLWPLLQDGSYLFTDEAHHFQIAGVFYDEQWWKDELQAPAPGLVGAGNGIGLFPSVYGAWSSVGYTVKNPTGLLERPG